MTVAEYIANELYRRGIERVFELTGGMITLLIDALYRDGRVQVVSLRHEQSAAIAADVYGRMTGKPGVALATSGPGATNLLTGIAGAFFDSSPAVFITGQVNRNEQRCHRKIRQQGFQETDIVAMARPVTKAAWLVENAKDIPQMLAEAFALAIEGRPGPVLLDIPMDIQGQELINIPVLSDEPNKTKVTTSSQTNAIHLAVSVLATAQRPLILAGGGIRAANAVALFRSWIDQIKVPVVHSLMGVDVLPSESPYRIGLIGTNGNRWANKALVEADMLLVIGSRLDIRQTGADVSEFCNRPIIHVDCIDEQVNNRVIGCTPIIVDICDALPLFQKISQAITWPERKEWVQCIDNWHRQRTDCDELGETVTINPNRVIQKATTAFPKNRAIVTDVGQNQMWAAQSAFLHKNERFITAGGLGPMGFALPAAISTAMESGETLLVAGDGGFQMNIQELQSVAQQKLPLRMIILNNQCLGMVRQFQEVYFEGRLQSTVWGYSAPDFEKISLAYGIPARTLSTMAECEDALDWMKAQQGPCLLQVMLDQKTDLLPKVKFGKPLSQMDPVVDLLD